MTHMATVGAFVLLAACAALRAPKPALVPAEQINWPPPPDPPRIVWTGQIASSRDVEPPGFMLRLAEAMVGGRAPVTFRKPFYVTTDSRGRVFVSDTGWGQVLMFDRAGARFGWRGADAQGKLQKPSGVATDDKDDLFVSDMSLGRVVEFDADGKFLRAIGSGVLERPVGVAWDAARRRLWVTDARKHAVLVFDEEGNPVMTVGERGSGDCQFNFPAGIAISAAGEVFVMDTMNFRVQVLDLEGKFLRKWGKNCDGFGCFSRAKGIAVDPDGNVHVLDAAFSNVQVFDREGRLLMAYGGQGNGPGLMVLPAGLHIDPAGNVYAVSQYNWRVNTYRYVPEVATATSPPSAPELRSPEAGR